MRSGRSSWHVLWFILPLTLFLLIFLVGSFVTILIS